LSPADQQRSLTVAVGLEAVLAGAALLLGWIFDFPPLREIRLEWRGPLLGALLALPLAAGFALTVKFPVGMLQEIREKLDQHLLPLFRGLSIFELFLVSLMAGIGEELLFRGFLQTAATHYLGLTWALVLTNLLFGLAHWITPAYGITAGLLGALLGWSMYYTDNLLTPIVTHTLYDFVALWFYLRVVHKPERV
jgi:hypothetical protein